MPPLLPLLMEISPHQLEAAKPAAGAAAAAHDPRRAGGLILSASKHTHEIDTAVKPLVALFATVEAPILLRLVIPSEPDGDGRMEEV
ncbi:MAG: hypothetical protein ACKOPN_03870 [Prochlorococcaceae cyanobacterium]